MSFDTFAELRMKGHSVLLNGGAQNIVAEKNLEDISAQFDAVREMARHFAGVQIPVDTLYADFRRGWEAGCDKGPDEVIAMEAWAAYAEKS
jgi:hypothetical protein